MRILRAENVRRCIHDVYSPTSSNTHHVLQLKSILQSTGKSTGKASEVTAPVGVFLRVFRSRSQLQTNITANLDEGNKENTDDVSRDASFRDGRQPREELICETAVHEHHDAGKTREETINCLDFTWKVIVKGAHFPLRLSLYDVDRNKVRICLGHTLLSKSFLQQQLQTSSNNTCIVASGVSSGVSSENQVVSTHILHSTIASAVAASTMQE